MSATVLAMRICLLDRSCLLSEGYLVGCRYSQGAYLRYLKGLWLETQFHSWHFFYISIPQVVFPATVTP